MGNHGNQPTGSPKPAIPNGRINTLVNDQWHENHQQELLLAISGLNVINNKHKLGEYFILFTVTSAGNQQPYKSRGKFETRPTNVFSLSDKAHIDLLFTSSKIFTQV